MTTTGRTAEKNVHPIPSLYNECGVTSMDNSLYYVNVASRIVGGRQAVPHTHPWQVLINYRGRYCGGDAGRADCRTEANISLIVLASILNARWLITAAHCVNGYGKK